MQKPQTRRSTRLGAISTRALILCAAIILPGTSGHSSQQAPPLAHLPIRGIALGLFAEDNGFDYRPLLEEIKAVGASHVSIVVPHYQHDIRSLTIAPHPRFSPPADVVRRTLTQAKALGLKVLLFPILRLEYKVTVREWRGSIRPKDPPTWWANYRAWILGFADLAQELELAGLCVGSELGSMDTDPRPWKPLIAEIRQRFSGQLIYSANWDHFDKVTIWHLVDQAGLSAYFHLASRYDPSPTLESMVHSWREHRVRIARFWARIRKPLVFTELGFASQRGVAAAPWDEGARAAVDLEEQRRCFIATFRAWRGAPYLRGLYIWNWYGWGGERSREYTPRGKPAAQVICRYFGGKACAKRGGQPWFDDQKR